MMTPSTPFPRQSCHPQQSLAHYHATPPPPSTHSTPHRPSPPQLRARAPRAGSRGLCAPRLPELLPRQARALRPPLLHRPPRGGGGPARLADDPPGGSPAGPAGGGPRPSARSGGSAGRGGRRVGAADAAPAPAHAAALRHRRAACDRPRAPPARSGSRGDPRLSIGVGLRCGGWVTGRLETAHLHNGTTAHTHTHIGEPVVIWASVRVLPQSSIIPVAPVVVRTGAILLHVNDVRSLSEVMASLAQPQRSAPAE